MFVATIPNRNSPPAILIRESYREGSKVKTRTIANISSWPGARVEAVRRALKGEFDDCLGYNDVSDRSFGLLYATKHVADRLGVTQALGNSRTGKLALFLVLARVAHQGSRLSAVRWAEEHAVAEVLNLTDFDENDLYQALDWLENSQKRIEKSLYRRYCDKHGAPAALVLYDVTSSYFEGDKNELAEYGHNRDGKKGKKQIVIGLLTAADGEPLAIRVFKGNTSDNTTVIDQINILKHDFGVDEVVFVGDRGMVKAKQKGDLSAAEFKYITALTTPQVGKLIKKGVIQPDLFDKTIHEVEHGSLRLILRLSEATRRKEQHRREDKLRRLDSLIEQRNAFVATSKRADPEAGKRRLERWVKAHKLSNFVTLSLVDGQLCTAVDQAKKQDDALLDGCYVLETNVPSGVFNTETVGDRYMDLQKVEADFRLMKTVLLQIRPIFVRKANRTRGHAVTAMLALKTIRYMREQLALTCGTTDDDARTVTVDDAIETLSNWCLVRSEVRGASFLRLPKPNDRQTRVLNALNIPVPTIRTVQNSRPAN